MKTLISLKSRRIPQFGATILAALAVLSALPTNAADIFWTGATASYTNAANWTGGVVPGPADNAINTNGSPNRVQINSGNPDWTVVDLQAGSAEGTSGAFEQNGQTVSAAGWVRLGLAVNSVGAYTLNGGTLNVLGGRIMTGESEGSSATIVINGGVLNKTGDFFILADAGFGTPHNASASMVQNGGTINSSSEIWIGQGTGGVGSFDLHAGGTINSSNWFVVGRGGAVGTMNMDGGSILHVSGGTPAFIVADNALGTLNHSAGTITTTAAEFWVGNGGPAIGTNNLSGTAVVNVGNWIAYGRGGIGVLNLSGNAAVTKSGGGNVVLGAFGGSFGLVNQTGGAFTNTTSQTWIGETTAGQWDISGGVAILGVVHLGHNNSSSGILNLNGGVFGASEITKGIAGAFGVLNFNGGTLAATASSENFLHDLDAANVGAGGVAIDTAGFNVTAAQALLDNGGGALTKNGAGTLTLGGANGYTGASTVNGGKLAVTTDSSGAGSYSVANGANLGVKVQAANAQLNVASLTLATSTSASLDLDLGAFGNPSSAPVNVSGALAVNGAITVNLTDGFPQLGQFPLVKYGSRTGSGSFVLGSVPTGVVASIVTNGPNSSIDLNITTVNTPRWDGQAGGNWDIGLTTNWVNAGTGLPTTYGNGNPVTFDDNALGTTTVNLVTTVSPASVTANNTNLAYSLVGSGKISGAATFTKQGANTFVIANTGGNNYTGRTVLSAGTLSVTNLANGGSPSAIGASSANPTNLVFAGGTLSYAGPATAINRGYSSSAGAIETVNNLTLSGTPIMGGGGELRKTGPAQLAYTGTGSNDLSGYLVAGSTYRIVNGTVLLDGSAGPQTNYSRNLRLGLADATNILNTALVLTNTILDVRNGFNVGDHNNATATLTMDNSTLFHRGNGNAFDLGDNNNGLPCSGVVIQNSSTFNADGEIWVGQTTNGFGSYTLNSGTINLHNWLAIGRSGGSGTFNMTGGTFNKDANGNIVIGTGAGSNTRSGYGTLNHSAGTINTSREYWLGENTPATGTNNISGSAVLNLSNWMSIGRGGLGVINFSGGTINKTGNGNFIVGDNGIGLFIQTGGSLSINSELWIGQAGGGNGTYNLSAGTVTNNSWLAIGREGADGVLNISGGSMTKNGGGNISIAHGVGASGTVNQTGGSFTCGSGETWIGEDNGPGIWTISGGTATLRFVQLARTASATGELNLNGGTFAATELTTGSSGTSTLNLNGGTLVAASGASLNFLHDLTTANVLAGGAVINSGTNVINISQALLDGGGGGGLTKNGSGTLRLNGVNTYTGATLVNAGTLGGNGTIAGPVSVAAGAVLAPGTSVGTLTINGTLGLAGTSTSVMELSKVANTNDHVTGVTTLTYGGTLVLKNIGGVLAVNDTFDLFDATTSSGSFSSVVSQTPGQTVTWDLSNLAVNGTVRVASVVAVPVTLASLVSGGNLNLTWPADQLGWRLEAQTNSLAIGISNNWVTIPGSTEVTGVSVPIVPGVPTAFFRLNFP